jgi:hypothetical protein
VRAAAARRLGPVRSSDQRGDGSHSQAGERDVKQEKQVTRSIAASALFRGQCGSVTEVPFQGSGITGSATPVHIAGPCPRFDCPRRGRES